MFSQILTLASAYYYDQSLHIGVFVSIMSLTS